jgi:hypothetical protein
MLDTNRMDPLVQTQVLRQRVESARDRNGDTARRCYEEALALLHVSGEPPYWRLSSDISAISPTTTRVPQGPLAAEQIALLRTGLRLE